jgi:hypothetical protein
MAAARSVVCTSTISGVDDEWPGGSETKTQNNTGSLVLSNEVPQNLLNTQMKWGGECRCELTLVAQLQSTGRVLIRGNAKLFEGDSEETGDLDDEENFEILVAKGKTESRAVNLLNEGSNDTADIMITVTNTLVEEEQGVPNGQTRRGRPIGGRANRR